MARTTANNMTKSDLYSLSLTDVKTLGADHRELGYSVHYAPYRHAPLTAEMSAKQHAWITGWHEKNITLSCPVCQGVS